MKYKDQIDKVKNYTGGKETGAANALGDFAILLGMLAEDADKNSEIATQVSKDNLVVQTEVKELTKVLNRYTKWLIFLTVATFLAALTQILLGFFKPSLLPSNPLVQTFNIPSEIIVKSDKPNQTIDTKPHADETAPDPENNEETVETP